MKEYRPSAPGPAEWPGQGVPEGPAASQRRRPRTIDMPGAARRGAEAAGEGGGPFPSEWPAPRPASAVAMGISDERGTNRKYPAMEPD